MKERQGYRKLIIDDFAVTNGYILGHFMPEGSNLRTGMVEVARIALPQKDESPAHYHQIMTEITYCLSGKLYLELGEKRESVVLEPGELLLVNPGTVLRNPRNDEGTICITIKWPSVDEDKYYVD